MRIVAKSLATLAGLAFAVFVVAATVPETPQAVRFLGVLVIVALLAWVALTIWWLLRLRSPRRRPQRAAWTIQMPDPRWYSIGVPAVLGVALVVGYLLEVSVSVLIGGFVGPAVAVLLHRRRLRRQSMPRGQ